MKSNDKSKRPYTPATLAERWECSPEHVRRLLNTGQLEGFRLGDKLWRIRVEDVEEFESQATPPNNAGWGS